MKIIALRIKSRKQWMPKQSAKMFSIIDLGKLSIEKRLEVVERQTDSMDAKIQEIIRLAETIAEVVGCEKLNKTVRVRCCLCHCFNQKDRYQKDPCGL